MNSKTHIVVMEVVSQHLEEHKNNGLICNLHEILSGQIRVCCIVWFLVNHGFVIWLRNFYGIYYTSIGVALKNWMKFRCKLVAHSYFISEVYAAGIKQWTVWDMPNFEDLILKLGWIFLSYNLICSSVGMLGSYINFLNWFLYGLDA